MSPGPTEEPTISRTTRAAAVAAALLVTLPTAAIADQEAHADASPAAARPVAEAALLPRAPRLLTAGPVLLQPARVAPVEAARQAVGAAPDSRSIRPASRSMTRRAAVRTARRAQPITRVARAAHRVEARQVARARSVLHRVSRRASGSSYGLAAVAAFARAQVGKPYIWGSDGGRGYDCSGLTKAAYARIGVSLPHQSGAQAGRARTISLADAVPGDLVVGSGHVGIYQGDGMMTDAPGRGRHILYRKMFAGLHVERVNR